MASRMAVSRMLRPASLVAQPARSAGGAKTIILHYPPIADWEKVEPIDQEKLPESVRWADFPKIKWTSYFPDIYIPPKEFMIQEKWDKNFKEWPERDLKNFPHYERPNYPSPTRHALVPLSWFNAFYEKTGVSGPYLFVATAFTAALSKEIYVVDRHEGWLQLVAFLAIGVHRRLFGPPINALIDTYEENFYRSIKSEHIFKKAQTEELIQGEKECQTQYPALASFLYSTKRENVALQLEIEYRNRLKTVHDQVKRRLDYLTALDGAKRRFEMEHQVNWIIDQVQKSVTPELEAAALKQCVADLKTLAATQ